MSCNVCILYHRILGLDIIVRDGEGDAIWGDVTSTIELFRAHDAALKRTKHMMKGSNHPDRNSGSASNLRSACMNYSLLVTVEHFMCKVGDDADLIMSLYDGRETRVISENYVIKWGKEGMVKDLDQLNNMSVVFTVSITRHPFGSLSSDHSTCSL